MLVQLSDLHLGAEDGDPLADARRAVGAVAALHPRPAAVLVTGDLAEHGRPEEYAAAAELLATLGLPVHVLPGNHDAVDELRRAFPAGAGDGGAYRWAARCGPLRVVGCDTTVPGRDEGRLSAEHLAWLRARLEEDRATPTLVAMHHPPVPVGIPFLDRIGLAADDRPALAALLADHPAVRCVTTGHVHLASAGRLGATPVVTGPSTWRVRARLRLGAEGIEPAELPAGMLVHALVEGELVSHVQPLA